MKKFVQTFPFLPKLERMVPTEKKNRDVRWVCPCSTRVYNDSLQKWFPCHYQDEFLLDTDNPTCSNGKGHLYASDMDLIDHVAMEKDIRHKLISTYLVRVCQILIHKNAPKAALKPAPKAALKPVPKAAPKAALKPVSKAVPKTGPKAAPKPGPKATPKPGVIGLSSTQFLEIGSVNQPESTPEINEIQEVINMTVDETSTICNNEQKDPITKKRSTRINQKSLLTNYTGEVHAPDEARKVFPKGKENSS